MDDTRYKEEIEKLEKERELLLTLLSDEERAQYEMFKQRFSETDYSQSLEKEEEEENPDKE